MSIATRIGRWALCAAALACQGAVHAQATSQVKPLATDQLYQSLGAKAGLVRLADDFVERLWRMRASAASSRMSTRRI